MDKKSSSDRTWSKTLAYGKSDNAPAQKGSSHAQLLATIIAWIYYESLNLWIGRHWQKLKLASIYCFGHALHR